MQKPPKLTPANQRTYDILERCVRMLRVASKGKPHLRDGLEAGASLIELYQEFLDPKGKILAMPIDRLTGVFTNIRAPHEVEMPQPLTVRGSMPKKRPQTMEERSASSLRGHARHPFAGKSGAIQQRIITMKHKGMISFAKSLVPLLEGETYGDLHNALRALKNKGYIEPHTLMKRHWSFIKQPDPVSDDMRPVIGNEDAADEHIEAVEQMLNDRS